MKLTGLVAKVVAADAKYFRNNHFDPPMGECRLETVERDSDGLAHGEG